MENHYKKALEAAKKEMFELLPQHTAIEKRIAMLRQTIATLTALSENPDPDTEQVFIPSELQRAVKSAVAGMAVGMMGTNMPLSEAVREVLKASGKPMTSVQVRDGLVRMGIDIENKYTSPLAVIHKALKRLGEKGEAKTGTSKDGKTTYQWKSVELIASEESALRRFGERPRKNFLQEMAEKKTKTEKA